MHRIAAWISFGIVSLASLSAVASGTISNALSAREAGRGGANIAFSDNGVILQDNPAGMQGLVGDCCCQNSFIDLGAAPLFTDLSYADDENQKTDARNDLTALGHFMIGRRVHPDIVLGFGAFAPAGFSSEYDLNGPPLVPGPQTYMGLGLMTRILPGISARLTERLTVGATIGASVSHVETGRAVLSSVAAVDRHPDPTRPSGYRRRVFMVLRSPVRVD